MITQEKGARLEFKCDRLLSASSHSELAIRCGVGAFSVAFCALFRFTFNVRDNRFSSFSLSLSLSFFTHWQGCINTYIALATTAIASVANHSCVFGVKIKFYHNFNKCYILNWKIIYIARTSICFIFCFVVF